ncbi:MAG: Uncharacterised protein [Flavobacteriaceae bacterium]|nr:MAG: Uncharacterised protein [Flavobacteriaceae bacterium]
MKKAVLVLTTVATLMSCAPEVVVVEQDEQVEPTEESRFTGDYELYRIMTIAPQAGELISDIRFDCPSTWIFQAEFNLRTYIYQPRGEDCEFKYQSNIFYTTPEDDVIVVGGATIFKVTRQGDNAILTNTNTPSDTQREYFLRKIN